MYIVFARYLIMKMKSVFVLLAAVTLVACSSNSSQIVSSSSVEDLSSSSIEESSDATSESSANKESSSSNNVAPSSTTADSSSNNTGTSSQSQASSSSNASSSSGESEDGTVTRTVSFLNGGFTGSLDEAKSQTSFVAWFNGNDNILSSIVCTNKAQMNYIGNQSDSWRFSTLILGSQNNLGTITFNFSVHVTQVKIVVQPYTKYISYNNTYNIDKSATFIFNTEEHDLSVDSSYSGETEKITLNCTPNPNENKFTISNKENNQRVFVHSFELTYLG